MQNICLVGASGRMGKAIQSLLPSSVQTYCFNRLANHKDTFFDAVKMSNVVIDFSNPENFELAIEACLIGQTPFFCGTTGLGKQHFELLKTTSTKIPVLYAANTSIGIAILKKAIVLVAKTLNKTNFINDTDIVISETHHNLKKDSPSGTALSLGNAINQELQDLAEINYSSLRGGNVVGEHTVHFFHKDEVIRLSHECLNRNVFASGAIKAAEWLFSKPAGLYCLEDMLEL
ncbi:MAG: 4-hydroxy-tetrahydrodipicolinate reductase [Proteobacteria bacterium]|nr:4-hydroxy-tetrahydrodipicolinate reductase [Pseudomonadota bacterium]